LQLKKNSVTTPLATAKKILVATLLANEKKFIALSQQTSYIMHTKKRKAKDMEKNKNARLHIL
jgi:hypothetical protein